MTSAPAATVKTLGNQTLGGDFELRSLSLGPQDRLLRFTAEREGTWTSSGRGALVLLLEQLREQGIRHVHLPAYLCESILGAVKHAHFDYSFYPVTGELKGQPDPPKHSATLIIHYFGWINALVENFAAGSANPQVAIVDASQALLTERAIDRHSPNVLFSLRKWGPIPLGGWCSREGPAIAVSEEAQLLFWKSLAARFMRGAYLSSDTLEDRLEKQYLQNLAEVEKSLDANPGPHGLPPLALDIMAGVDWDAAAFRRRRNWLVLQQFLAGNVDPVMSHLPDDVVPLGYVLRTKERDLVRSRLAHERIYCPIHWPLPAEVDGRQFPEAVDLAQSALTLPIDQRYGDDQMEWMARRVLRNLGRKP